MPESRLRTLGAFEFTIEGAALARPSTQKARALLAFLVLNRNRSVSREEIIELFWPEAADLENARQNVNTALWSIRRVIRDAGHEPSAFFEADKFIVRWLAPTALDAEEFERAALARDPHAVNRYSGDFLPGDYEPWSASHRERLLQRLEALLVELVQNASDIHAAQRLLQLDPFNEPAYAALIETELKAGRVVAAQALLRRYRDVLQQNGLEPSPEFTERFQQSETAESIAAPLRFIGRTRELTLLEQHLSQHHAAAVIHADAGFGKSTLLQRVHHRLTEHGTRCIVLARAAADEGFGGWETVYEGQTGKPFTALLEDRGGNVARALAQEITRSVAPGTCVFIDDAQQLRGDAAFVTECVVAAAPEHDIRFCIATRPEGLASVLRWTGASAPMDLPLGPLSLDEIRAAIPARGSGGASIAERLYNRTAGHPLFLERLMQDASTNNDRLEMPASVRAAIQARLRERGDDPFALASLFALDPAFSTEELAQMLDWDEERVLTAVDDLFALGILRETLKPPHLEFTHDVVMEVSRDAFTPQRRRRLHRRAAALLERDSSLAANARRARHIAAAGDQTAAAPLFLHCGEAALEVHEPRNAYAFLEDAERALLAYGPGAEAQALGTRISVAMVRALNASVEPERADRIARTAIARARAAGDRDALSELLAVRLRTSMRLGAIDTMVEDAQTLIGLAKDAADSALAAQAYYTLLHAYRVRMHESETLTYARRTLETALQIDDVDFALFLHGEAVHAYIVFWRFTEALAVARSGQALLARASGGAEPSYRYSLSQLFYLLERYDEAYEHVVKGTDALALHRRSVGRFSPDRQHTLAILTNMRGLISVAREDWDDACEAAELFAANPAARGNRNMHVHIADLIVRARLGRNAPGDVQRAVEALASVDDSAVPPDARMELTVARACVAARMKDENAFELIDAAIREVSGVADQMPLDSDTQLSYLAAAARDIGDTSLERRALAQHEKYRDIRRAKIAG